MMECVILTIGRYSQLISGKPELPALGSRLGSSVGCGASGLKVRDQTFVAFMPWFLDPPPQNLI